MITLINVYVGIIRYYGTTRFIFYIQVVKTSLEKINNNNIFYSKTTLSSSISFQRTEKINNKGWVDLKKINKLIVL